MAETMNGPVPVSVYPRAYGVDAGTIAAGGNGSVYPRAYGVDTCILKGFRDCMSTENI